jgi:Tol biopolymer transport system component
VTVTSVFAQFSGKLVYQSGSYGSYTDQIYLYDFTANTNTLLNTNWVAADGTALVDNTSNPQISPDGQWLIFMAVPHGQDFYDAFDVYLWKLDGSLALIDLTANSGPTTPDEDPKWAPDGAHVIFKQNGNIALMTLNLTLTMPVVSIEQLTTDGVIGTSTEHSMPFFMPNQSAVVYSNSAKINATLETLTLNSDNTISTPTQLGDGPGLQEDYPVPWQGDNKHILFTRWDNATSMHNEICSLDITSTAPQNGETPPLPFVLAGYDNDDAYPADQIGQYVFFGSNRPGGMGGSDLYLGDAIHGTTWSLSALGINTANDELAPAYYPGK